MGHPPTLSCLRALPGLLSLLLLLPPRALAAALGGSAVPGRLHLLPQQQADGGLKAPWLAPHYGTALLQHAAPLICVATIVAHLSRLQQDACMVGSWGSGSYLSGAQQQSAPSCRLVARTTPTTLHGPGCLHATPCLAHSPASALLISGRDRSKLRSRRLHTTPGCWPLS